MTNTNISLRPIHYASVSGGKDSLYMLGLILKNQDKYPLDVVVNFDLEIDWQIAKDVVNEMEKRCNQAGIPFVRIKPRKPWKELYDKYGFPKRQINEKKREFEQLNESFPTLKKAIEEWQKYEKENE